MDLNMTEILKYLYPLLPVIVSIIGLKAGWIYKRDKVFNSRKAISEFSYSLYKNTNDENFKRIAEEYGISALTKDSNLTPEQRRILLRSKDPVRDIDNYSKCQKLLYVSDNSTIFQWTKKRYRFWIWRKAVEITSCIIYFMSGFVVAMPFMYSTMLSSDMVEKINTSSAMIKFGLASYCVLIGISIGMLFLHKLSTINVAEKTIKSNR
ncbi:hypothetical protein JKA33_15360 [Klebsiella quasipneumoniae]|nr:hypothetical protein AVR78_24530 [Klebsiella quasipneumoniae]AWO62556.1 hypothetical protein DLJ73_16665 [Klebsiella quasipneumoniae subsp. similipneumoniae]AVF90703.1 hypothetical protein AL473_24740 [Klebsiella quasipneumoniae]EMR17846.1 hypothetical protein KP700603_19557 [Klebsiella quasipneumoniae]MBK5764203.1 hypothetical protein [Klebsiella quasipneumoniae]